MKQLPTRAFKGYGGAQQLMVPEFDLPVPTATFATCGAGLNRGFEWLDLTARVRGLPSLLAFCDHRPVPGGLDKWLKMLDKRTPEQVSEALVMAMDKTHGPWTDWFPVDQGLTTVDGLLEVLEREGWKAATCALNRECPGLLKGRYEPASAGDVVADLRALAACLRIAGEAGAKFRLTRTTPFFVRSPV